MVKNKNPIKDVPRNLFYAFNPLFRPEALTGLAGYVLIVDGIVKGNGKEVIAGLVTSALSGLYGAYKDIKNMNNEPIRVSNLENSLN